MMNASINFLKISILLLIGSVALKGQCDLEDDYSSFGSWTQVGEQVTITNGVVEYQNGSSAGADRRVYKFLDDPISDTDCWNIQFEFYAEEVGEYQSQPFPGHMLMGLSENSNSPFADCPDLPCTGNPTSTQQSIFVLYGTTNPPDGNMHYRVVFKDGGVWNNSEYLIYNSYQEWHYFNVKRICDEIELCVYSDADHTNLINDCVYIEINSHSDLNVLHHGSSATGSSTRQMTGVLDNLCLDMVSCHEETSVAYEGCIGDGYSVIVNNVTYDELNPNGIEMLNSSSGCDSIVTVQLEYNENYSFDLNYIECQGSGFELNVGGQLFDETNPDGVVMLTSQHGCDSIISVNIDILEPALTMLTYEGCNGDGYSYEVNGVLYNESNPTGTEWLTTATGCDSVVTIQFEFSDAISTNLNYTECQGSGFELNIGGALFNESNPQGLVTLQSENGCDSLIAVQIDYVEDKEVEYGYEGCEGDGYNEMINGVHYNEGNPSGIELFTSAQGCDSIVYVMFEYHPISSSSISIEECQGSGFELEVAGTIFNESNPQGEVNLTNAMGCDSIIMVSIDFTETAFTTLTYSGCIGDGYSEIVNGVVYDETNPTGVQWLNGESGCDSVVTIQFEFNEAVSTNLNYTECQGSGFELNIGGTLFNESNPQGLVTLQNDIGCDSIITVQIDYVEEIEVEYVYEGCGGDGYSEIINGVQYNEGNPSGIELFTSAQGCDSIVHVDMTFEQVSDPTVQYAILQCNDPITLPGAILYDLDQSELEQVAIPGSYLYTFDSSVNCVVYDTLVVENELRTQVYFPNIINVNSAYNNCFNPTFSNEMTKEYTLSIFDRWGGLIFEDSGSNVKWCPDGDGLVSSVFVYLINIHDDCQASSYSGDITVLK